jgi:hypothetical protein
MTRAAEIRHDAQQAAACAEPQRRLAVLDLVKERWRPADIDPASALIPGPGYKIVPGDGIDETEADIFRLAYGDPAAAEYWRAWLYEPLSKWEFINLLAGHRAESAAHYEILFHRLEASLKAFPVECGRAEAERLAANPNTAALLPGSLRRWLRPESRAELAVSTPRPDQAALDQALLEYAIGRGERLKQNDVDANALLRALNATDRQRLAAFRKLPDEFRYRRGNH